MPQRSAEIPQEKRKARVVCKDGKITARLSFEKKRRRLYAARDAPVDAIGVLVRHEAQTRSNEDNAGSDAANTMVQGMERISHAARSAYRIRKERSYHQTQYTESPAYQRQKQAIKKKYATTKTRETTERTSEVTEKAAEKAVEATKAAATLAIRHRRGIWLIVVLLALAMFMASVFSSCFILLDTGLSTIAVSTYPSADSDMCAAEALYLEKERALQEKLEHYPRNRNCDEYRFETDAIEHDPYALISIITALKGGAWKIGEVGGIIDSLFDRQYILTEEMITETRYRTETGIGTRTVDDPNTGTSHTEYYRTEKQVPYGYQICVVRLENFVLSHVPVYMMTSNELSLYAAYMGTLGNRPDLFADSGYIRKYYTDHEKYEIPPEALEDTQFAAMIAEAEKYLGYPYVWGGSSPSTSFDCSGFVSWVINHCGVGWNLGRCSANGLLDCCTRVSAENAKSGDLVFFAGTYDTAGASHVGIYVGDGMMLHCGDPIQYSTLETDYWRQHFLAFGRLPQP